MIYAAAIIALSSVMQMTAATQYCANIEAKSAGGASGNVALQISEGVATYGIYLDMTGFTFENCDAASGLNYHIHSYWNNVTSSSSSYGFCGATYTGGHYDPNLACSPYSQNATNGCVDISRTATLGYTYSCTPTLYGEGKYSSCEIGDLSGKNGVLMPNTGTTIYELSVPFVDYQPPYEANYASIDTNSLQWTSVVFHCPATNARLVCAKFSADDLTPCSSTFSTFSADDDNNNDDDNKYTQHQFVTAVVASVLVCFIFGVILGIMFTRLWCPGNASMASSADNKV